MCFAYAFSHVLDTFGVLRTKTLQSNNHRRNHHGSLVMDSIYISLCVELGFDGTYELLTGILGVSYVAGALLASN